MKNIEETSKFQKALEVIEALPIDDQAMLVDIIQQRLRQQRRDELLQEVVRSQQEYEAGTVRRGSVMDLLTELSP
ncbi:hypothetical protein J0895_12755 [Phormidium pseudopriestleyi FRX01]|uniref:Addiction module component n=1 Tax=Phormidium pseudopriestleyi FRX01 TaxID=1759528 RepID=A0ABS3FS71_9CYAN|nr:hypothetical protein [Phormidium pseudopriestleyi]MBO0349965.1 hypothetical protein [Phormidium pseudopriestleyi FRX01]